MQDSYAAEHLAIAIERCACDLRSIAALHRNVAIDLDQRAAELDRALDDCGRR